MSHFTTAVLVPKDTDDIEGPDPSTEGRLPDGNRAVRNLPGSTAVAPSLETRHSLFTLPPCRRFMVRLKLLNGRLWSFYGIDGCDTERGDLFTHKEAREIIAGLPEMFTAEIVGPFSTKEQPNA
jgi:hypothetical protein